jgi:hypothetical protein
MNPATGLARADAWTTTSGTAGQRIYGSNPRELQFSTVDEAAEHETVTQLPTSS